ncbi:MAG TPA: hypothetical protein VM888_10885 [Chitinophagaceae bacterium]|jgi:hypothetical protein|nr:hypothetical protein [Chitinophagaceae bacterium]
MEKNVAEGLTGNNVATNYHQVVENKSYPKEIVDLNEVVKDCLSAVENELQRINAIVRYDALPLISGNKKKLLALFSNLFHSIIKHPPKATKLFIYVRSQRSSSDIMDLSLPDGYQNFTISVHTNILCNEAWQKVYEKALLENSSLLHSIGGFFTFNSIVNTGCLYTLQLPGKPIE